VSGSARCLIRCLLQKDPNVRPSCGEILNHSWINSGGQGSTRGTSGPCRGSSSNNRTQRLILPSGIRIESTPGSDTLNVSAPITSTPTSEMILSHSTASSNSHNSVYIDNSLSSDFSSSYSDFLSSKGTFTQPSSSEDQVVPCIDPISQ